MRSHSQTLLVALLTGAMSTLLPDGAAAQDEPVVVQPGAPGEPTRVLDRADLEELERPGHTAADVEFIRKMIPHHRQALEMVDLLRERTDDESLRRMALRIEISQEDEIRLMRRWLEERDEPVEVDRDPWADPEDAVAHGMLSRAQMERLAAARGEDFERLFLELMIEHHRGALRMVEELFRSPGAAQASAVFHLASEIQADQDMEIERMQSLLEEER